MHWDAICRTSECTHTLYVLIHVHVSHAYNDMEIHLWATVCIRTYIYAHVCMHRSIGLCVMLHGVHALREVLDYYFITTTRQEQTFSLNVDHISLCNTYM